MEYFLTNAIHEICESHGFSSKIESVAIDVMFDVYDCCDIESLSDYCDRALNALCDGTYLACLNADEDIIEFVYDIYQQLKESIYYLYVITRNGMTVPDSELPGLREYEDSIGYSEPHGFSIMEFMEKNNFCGLERSAENKYALIEYEKMSYGDIEGASEIIEEF